MNGTLAVIATVLVALNPPAVARLVGFRASTGALRGASWTGVVAIATAVAAGVLLLLAGVSGPLLDALDLSAPTLRLGAAIVVGVAGARAMVWPAAPVALDPGARSGVALLVGAGFLAPQAVFAAVAGGATDGVGVALAAILLGLGTCVVLLLVPRPAPLVLDLGTRFVGAAAIVVAIAVGIDAARTV